MQGNLVVARDQLLLVSHTIAFLFRRAAGLRSRLRYVMEKCKIEMAKSSFVRHSNDFSFSHLLRMLVTIDRRHSSRYWKKLTRRAFEIENISIMAHDASNKRGEVQITNKCAFNFAMITRWLFNFSCHRLTAARLISTQRALRFCGVFYYHFLRKHSKVCFVCFTAKEMS